MKYIHDDPNKFNFFRRFLIGDTMHYQGITDEEAMKAIQSGQDQWLLICTKKGDGNSRSRYYPVPKLLEEGWAKSPHFALEGLEMIEALFRGDQVPSMQPTPESVTTDATGGPRGIYSSLLNLFKASRR